MHILDQIKQSNKTIFSISDIAKIGDNTIKQESLVKKIYRLAVKEEIITLKRGLYYLKNNKPSYFEIANALYNPSYISLKSALNYHGVLIQLPQIVESVTLKKTYNTIKYQKEYKYYHIDSNYYQGYELINNVLIATPEKALIDQIYYAGFGKIKFNFDELILDNIVKAKLKYFAKKVKNKSFQNLFQSLNIC